MALRLLRFLGIALLTIAVAVLLYLAAAWQLSLVVLNAEAAPPTDGVPVYLLSNGVHTDLVLPLDHPAHTWRTLVDPHHTTRPDSLAHWVAFGWGDKGFYLNTPTWADLTASTAFKAAFGLGGTAMHLTYHRQPVEGAQCHRILVAPEAYARLVAYITASFAHDGAGSVVRIPGAHYTTTDVFYEAAGRYHLFHTCNSWTNDGLKACGAKACLWTPFQAGLMDLYGQEP